MKVVGSPRQQITVKGRNLQLVLNHDRTEIYDVVNTINVSVTDTLTDAEWWEIKGRTGLSVAARIIYDCTNFTWHVSSPTLGTRDTQVVTLQAIEVLRNPVYRRAVQAVLDELMG